MNPVYKFLQSLPTNGYTTIIGGVGLVFFGLGGLITGKLGPEEGMGYIMAGLATLGLGSKIDKMLGSHNEPPSAS